MRIPSLRVISLALGTALLFVMLTVGSAFASPLTRTIQTTRSGQETLNVSPSVCAAFKAAAPARANDPTLCQMVHGWTEVDTQIVRQGVTPYNTGGCYYGSRYFHDYVKGVGGLVWEMDQNTTFWWYNVNTCEATPVLTQQSCYFAYERDTTEIDKGCYSYHYYSSTWSSTAAV
ncbi:MAG: hypothetical protein ACRDHP_06800, partial [Ktedonobacterales bacterium]